MYVYATPVKNGRLRETKLSEGTTTEEEESWSERTSLFCEIAREGRLQVPRIFSKRIAAWEIFGHEVAGLVKENLEGWT